MNFRPILWVALGLLFVLSAVGCSGSGGDDDDSAASDDTSGETDDTNDADDDMDDEVDDTGGDDTQFDDDTQAADDTQTDDDTQADDDTISVFEIHFRVKDAMSSAPVENAICELINGDGTSYDPPMSVNSGTSGWCRFTLDEIVEKYSAKVTATGYKDGYVFNYTAFPPAVNGHYWGHSIFMITPEFESMMVDPLGIAADPTKGHVVGNVLWTRTVPDVDFGPFENVGCAAISPFSENLFYEDSTGWPSNLRSTTDPASGIWYTFNMDPGSTSYTSTVDSHVVDTGAFIIYADSVTNVEADYPESEYPTNPTPSDCQ